MWTGVTRSDGRLPRVLWHTPPPTYGRAWPSGSPASAEPVSPGHTDRHQPATDLKGEAHDLPSGQPATVLHLVRAGRADPPLGHRGAGRPDGRPAAGHLRRRPYPGAALAAGPAGRRAEAAGRIRGPDRRGAG